MAQLTTMARPYAKAVFEAALADNALQAWSQMLAQVAAIVCDPRVRSLLSEPTSSAEKQAELLLALLGDDLNAKLKNFIRLLAENKRLLLLPEVVSLFESLRAEHEKRVEVEVVSAFALSESIQQKLASALKNRLQREVSLNTRVDKSLIGGVVIHAGDLVIDGSVRGRLNKLAETINA